MPVVFKLFFLREVFCLKNSVGFIGVGNMGSAIISGIVKKGIFDSSDIYVCGHSVPDDIKKLNINVTNLTNLLNNSDYIILCIKPKGFKELLNDIKQIQGYGDKVYVSVAAGIKISSIKQILGSVKTVRVMPNLPLKIGEGMTVVSRCELVSDEEYAFAEGIFAAVGKTVRVSENAIDACTAINGSGPAYVFMFIEALADAAVKNGIDRRSAYILASQTVAGSALMQLDTDYHPGVLKDMVCSPGGTTIDAVAELEKHGFRNSVISAVDACTAKAAKMGEQGSK